VIPGEVAFKLHDTYGFPIDLTCVMAEERGMTVDVEGFEKLMGQQREQSRAGTAHEENITLSPGAIDYLKKSGIKPTKDSYKYSNRPVTAHVEAIWNGSDFDNTASINRRVAVILDKTGFYAEAGGQAGDAGELTTQYEAGYGVGASHGPTTFEVEDTQQVGGYVLHIGRVTEGKLSTGETVEARVERDHRNPVRANHTATHLLNFALRETIAEDVDQKGSLVAPDRLRFDFSCVKALTIEQIEQVERIVNDKIGENLTVYADTVPLDLGKRINGLRAVFGEKYPDPVRVVSIGAPIDEIVKDLDNEKWRNYSIEFCGGTHLDQTEQARRFVIVKEESLAAGVRRMTAYTGAAAQAAMAAGRELLDRVEKAKGKIEKELLSEFDEISVLAEQITTGAVLRHQIHIALDGLRRMVKQIRKKAQAGSREKVVEQARSIAAKPCETSVIVEEIDGADKETILAALDVIKAKHSERAILLASPNRDEGKVMIVAAVPQALIEAGLKAGDWVREVARACGGGGGGRPDMAQAGGKDPSQTGYALQIAREYAENHT